MSLSSSPILVVAAHPDDEALGCGGTMAKAAALGFSVHSLFFTDGVGSRSTTEDGKLAAIARSEAALEALRRLGASAPTILGLPDNQLDSVPLLQLAQQVEAMVAIHRPVTILTHHADDLNVDHRMVHEAVMTACRPQPGFVVKNILCFEVPSSTEWRAPRPSVTFAPQLFVDISEFWEQKRAAMEAYAAEMRPWPHARSLESVEHLNRWRGSTVGVEAAEAFVVARVCV